MVIFGTIHIQLIPMHSRKGRFLRTRPKANAKIDIFFGLQHIFMYLCSIK